MSPFVVALFYLGFNHVYCEVYKKQSVLTINLSIPYLFYLKTNAQSCPDVMGFSMVPQARIAAVNTALTAAGMYAMAIPGLGLLSLFVFICSFIPIAGVFFSTVPIAFVALTEYGFIKVMTPPPPSISPKCQKYAG